MSATDAKLVHHQTLLNVLHVSLLHCLILPLRNVLKLHATFKTAFNATCLENVDHVLKDTLLKMVLVLNALWKAVSDALLLLIHAMHVSKA